MGPEDLNHGPDGPSSSVVRARVEAARSRMRGRQGKENARLTAREMDEYCVPDDAGSALLKQAIAKLGLSARGYHRVRKVARTIADVDRSGGILSSHIGEAIQYRRVDRSAT